MLAQLPGRKFFSFLLFLLISLCSAGQKFVIGVIPDTQHEVTYKPEMFMKQMEWLAAKHDSLNMPFVLHVGDIVDLNNDKEYSIVSDGFALLDKIKVPYAICPGNHDNASVRADTSLAAPGDRSVNLRITDKFNSYFPVKRYSNQKGRFEKNKSDNAYYVFKAGGVKWLVVTLEFCARHEAVEWANLIIQKFPKHNVIILTHSHLTARGKLEEEDSEGDLSPKEIFDTMIVKHPNIRLVLCGHTGTSTWRTDSGTHGNTIYQILQDYQNEDNGGGYIRLLEIDPSEGTINGKMYSPIYNKIKDDYSKIAISGVEFVGND
ncbi:MAG TPA: metallophosphoesterase [Bacteroidales bacterium]|nr:metallophosphoesterase [Bacteroidales bacterium]